MRRLKILLACFWFLCMTKINATPGMIHISPTEKKALEKPIMTTTICILYTHTQAHISCTLLLTLSASLQQKHNLLTSYSSLKGSKLKLKIPNGFENTATSGRLPRVPDSGHNWVYHCPFVC